MNRLKSFLFSSEMMIVLLLIFASSIGIATFIEEKYDTITAKILIYNSHWFEALLFLLTVNFLGHIGRYKMLSRKKLPGFIFHAAFIVMIIGAGITRYLSFEGMMHIREGQASNIMYSSVPYFKVTTIDNGQEFSNEIPFHKSPFLDKYFELETKTTYGDNIMVRCKNHIRNAVIVEVSHKGTQKEVTIEGGSGYIPSPKKIQMNDIEITLSYGDKALELPFSLFLNDFILERYPGSNSPSSFASEVTLLDKRNNMKMEYRIYMNHVLDYDGYRFFQSSYDKDEHGTILSVSHDVAGTFTSYFGYLLLGIGFILTLFNKNSRFWALGRKIIEIKEKRKSLVLLLVILIGLNGNITAQTTSKSCVEKEHAEKFGELVVQSFEGRFQPVHTLAYDVVHKLTKKNKFKTPEKGSLSGMQMFLDMIIDSEYWKSQRIIYIKEKTIRDILGIDDKYASFNDFFTPNGQFRLMEYTEVAFRKRQAEQRKFDKEIIKVNERLNIFMMVVNGSVLKIFPDLSNVNGQWASMADSIAFKPLSGGINIINEDLKLPVFNYSGIINSYFREVARAVSTNDYTRANKLLGYIDNIQRQEPINRILPSKNKIETEIHYNKANIFIVLRNLYAVLSILLLFFAFADNLRDKKNKLLTNVLNLLLAILAICFLYHTYGMGLRWYLTSHAPWSNGYEALITVAWGGLLAGFLFIRFSKITLAATALLAFLTLMIASFSSYDPQLTNLQPVLKSYWLIIHVVTIVISYGFLGLGFILGLINMFIIIFRNERNSQRLTLLLEEHTAINEMNLIIGLTLATFGTFLGAIWANESWGRYWGWDAKETWALVILIVYAIILHFRMVPKLKGLFAFNAGSVIGFGSVLMTFIGVNYYLSKGLHSYAAGSTPVFPIWAWVIIISVISLIIYAGVIYNQFKLQNECIVSIENYRHTEENYFIN